MGTLAPPGDKSLSHRALLFAALAGGAAELERLNPGEDVESTARALRALGVRVQRRGERWRVEGGGAKALRRPARAIDCGNSGTTMRLLAGVLAACPFESRLVGDASLSRRPMDRVADPLTRMGARVEGRRLGGSLVAPLVVRGGGLRPIAHRGRLASAQVKSAILLAACVAGVAVEVREPHRSRDHTERMLRALGARLRRTRGGVRLEAGGALRSPAGRVPGDPSAGAFFAAAAAALPGSDLVLEDVALNPTRLGFYRALVRMGARVEAAETRRWCGEPVGRLRVRPAALRAIAVSPPAVPALVDEIPVLAVLAAGAARGVTRIRGAGELRVKESDRIAALADGLARLGADVVERPDGLVIAGGRLGGGVVDARGDHRIAMAFRVAGLLASGRVRVGGARAMRISHPGFERDLARLLRGRR
ncbi:MAG: 3-phosphoshikimate 1-carboxyvinyltransferase [bacterium]